MYGPMRSARLQFAAYEVGMAIGESVTMRVPIRLMMPHTLLPGVKRAGVTEEGHVEGEFDLSRPYDPFETYLTNYGDSPHLQLAQIGAGAGEMRAFVFRWGPLTYRTCAQDQWMREHIFKLNHNDHEFVEPKNFDPR